MLGADLRIDHVTIAGKDLSKMRGALSAAGISTAYGGPHANHATEMALAAFADGSYLELIAAQPNADPAALRKHEWSAQIQGNAGPGAWAARVDNLEAERDRLHAAGVAVSEPEHAGRVRPDGFHLQWETAQIGAETRGTFFPFLIRDATPREERIGKNRESEIRGVERVVLAVRDLGAAAARFRAAYGWAAPMEFEDRAFGARVAVFTGTPVALASPINPNSWIATRLERFGEGPCALVFGSAKQGWKATVKSRWVDREIAWLDIAPVDATAIPWHVGME